MSCASRQHSSTTVCAESSRQIHSFIRRCVAKRTCSRPQDIPQDAIAAVWAAYTGGDVHFAPPGIASESSKNKAGRLGLSSDAAEVTEGLLYAQICEDLNAPPPLSNLYKTCGRLEENMQERVTPVNAAQDACTRFLSA